MINIAQSIVLGIGIVALSLAFLFAVDRLWPRDARQQHNDIVGWQVGVVGTTYAVIIGFMLYAVWNDFEAARNNVDAEADSLVNVSRLSSGLPDAPRDKIQAIAKHYADVMVSREWPSMRQDGSLEDSRVLTEELWDTVIDVQNLNSSQQAVLNYTISELTEMTVHRRIRQSQSHEGLPDILWSVLIVGAIVTLASSCLFGTKSFPLHFLQVFGLSTLLALALIAVAQIDRPFQGAVHVTPEAFVRAQQSLQLEAAHP